MNKSVDLDTAKTLAGLTEVGELIIYWKQAVKTKIIQTRSAAII